MIPKFACPSYSLIIRNDNSPRNDVEVDLSGSSNTVVTKLCELAAAGNEDEDLIDELFKLVEQRDTTHAKCAQQIQSGLTSAKQREKHLKDVLKKIENIDHVMIKTWTSFQAGVSTIKGDNDQTVAPMSTCKFFLPFSDT